jgi:hypothetical protein
MTKEDIKLTKKERGRPRKDNVPLNLRYPRVLDKLIRSDCGKGNPGDVIVPILMRHYRLSDE